MKTWRFLGLVFVLASLAAWPLLAPSVGAGARGGSTQPASLETPAQIPLYEDDFEDGDFAAADGSSGLAWNVVTGSASVDRVDGSLRLGAHRGGSLVVTSQQVPADEYTLCFDGRITWSEPGRIVVLYKDEDNYYSIGLGGQPGIYRTMDGAEVQLHGDPEGLLRLPHASAASGAFKVYVHNTGESIVVRADRAGDGVDYDIEIVDSNPHAVATFTDTGVGMMTTGDEAGLPWFYVDDVAIYDELIADVYEPVTYTVDRNHSGASDDNPGTENLPWRTIQKAADSVLAGDTVIVKAGTYDERIRFASGTRGAPNQVITFRAEPRRSVTMWGFDTHYGHYLRIEGFNITTHESLTGWTERNGVFLRSDHVEVVDNTFYDLKGAAVGGESEGAYVADNDVYRSQAGIHVSGANWVVERNEVERLFDHGGGDCDYSRFFGDGHIIRDNYFHGTDFDEIGSAHVDCFQTFDNNGEHAHNILFERNVCYDFHQGLMGSAAYYGNMSDLIFRNNIFAHGGAWGLCVYHIQNVTALHNVFADIRYHGIGLREGATGEVRNNIFYNAGSNYWGEGVTGSHNILYRSEGAIDPEDYPDDLVNVDPLFVDPAGDNYEIQAGSPAIDAGMNVGVGTDIQGTPRPQGPGYDIGAYEFTPALVLNGTPADQAIRLTWSVNVTLPVTSTWQIDYVPETGSTELPLITGIVSATWAYTLTRLTNYVWYTVTLNAMLDSAPLLTDTVRAMPTDRFVYLPLILGG